MISAGVSEWNLDSKSLILQGFFSEACDIGGCAVAGSRVTRRA